MEQAVEVLLRVTSQWGLTVSAPKTKLMVVGEGLQEDDVTPISTDSGVIDVVSDFKYLGALVSSSGGIEGEIRERIGHSSRVFGMLRKGVFQDSSPYQPATALVQHFHSQCLALLTPLLNDQVEE